MGPGRASAIGMLAGVAIAGGTVAALRHRAADDPTSRTTDRILMGTSMTAGVASVGGLLHVLRPTHASMGALMLASASFTGGLGVLLGVSGITRDIGPVR